VLEPGCHPRDGRAVPAARHRNRRATRQPRAGRRGAQAVRRLTAPAQAPRPGPSLRLPGGLLRSCRRSGPRRRREHRAGHPLLRSEGLSRHARGGQRAAAEEAAEPRRTGHGADLRRPDVRHRLRHGRAARHARGRRGRPAGAGPHRRLDHARRPVPRPHARGARRGARAPPRGVDRSAACGRPRLDPPLHRPRAAGRHRRRPGLPHRRQRSQGRSRLTFIPNVRTRLWSRHDSSHQISLI
jgi:hypothetical protein